MRLERVRKFVCMSSYIDSTISSAQLSFYIFLITEILYSNLSYTIFAAADLVPKQIIFFYTFMEVVKVEKFSGSKLLTLKLLTQKSTFFG